MQPYLFPYIGYFQLINAVDKFVVYDDVSYINRGWINRNNILVNNKKHLFTVVLDHSSPHKLINETTIKDNFVDLLKTIRFSYIKAPYFQKIFSLLEGILTYQNRSLSHFIANSLITISNYLDIKTEFFISSAVDKDNSLKGKDKIFHICKILGAKKYLNAIGGIELYDKSDFAANNIELSFLSTKPIIYKQFNNEFIPMLSIIDVMMFNPQDKIREMLNAYELV